MMSIYNEMNKKTQDAIQNAFIDLLLKKQFSKITIREIAEYAQVNRGAVYFHYEDKFYLLAKIEERLINSISRDNGTFITYDSSSRST